MPLVPCGNGGGMGGENFSKVEEKNKR